MDKFFIGTLTVIVIFIGIIVGMDYYVKSQNSSAPQDIRGTQPIYQSGLTYSFIDSLPTVLSDLGIDSNTTAIQSAKFKAIKKPSVTVLYQSTAATQDLGWNEDDEFTIIKRSIRNTKTTMEFAEKDKEFRLYLDVVFDKNYRWSTDASKNTDGTHVKIYPMQEDGKTIENSYLIAWEDWGRDKDFNDLVIRIDGVELTDLDDSNEE